MGFDNATTSASTVRGTFTLSSSHTFQRGHQIKKDEPRDGSDSQANDVFDKATHTGCAVGQPNLNQLTDGGKRREQASMHHERQPQLRRRHQECEARKQANMQSGFDRFVCGNELRIINKLHRIADEQQHERKPNQIESTDHASQWDDRLHHEPF